MSHNKKRGIGLKAYPDFFDNKEYYKAESENYLVEISSLRKENHELFNKNAMLELTCKNQAEEIIILKEYNARLETDIIEMRNANAQTAQDLAEALKDIEDEKTAFNLMLTKFVKLPAGSALDVFHKVSLLMVEDANWHRVSPIIYNEIINRLNLLEQASLQPQTSMNVAGDLVMSKEIKEMLAV